MTKTYDVQDVINAGYNLEPIKCRKCASLEVTFNQAMNDAHCAECGEWQLDIPKIKAYPETHQTGLISIEQKLLVDQLTGDFAIQIAEDGRIWICIEGIATIRFKPLTDE